MNPLIRVYNFHKREFGLEKNKSLRLFEELLTTSPCSILECSVKISPQGIHAERLRLGYVQQDIREGLHAIHDFFHKIAGCEDVFLNQDILDQIVNNNFDMSRVMAVGVGLDHQKLAKDSKVKCYLLVREYPEKVNQVLSLHPPLAGIREYLIHEEFTFGIDMYFDGRTGIEIYPLLDRLDLNNTALMDKLKLRDALREFIEECSLLHISFKDGGKRVLYFQPQLPTRFVRLLDNRQLSLAYSHVQIMNYILSQSYKKNPVSVNLCLLEDEITSKDIQNIDLQYALTYRA